MSKTLICGVISSFLVIAGSVTYFFPVLESINSIFNSKVETTPNSDESILINSGASSTLVSEIDIQKTDLNAENPKVLLNDDSIKKLNKSLYLNNPNKSKILEGEIPVTKNY